MAFVPLFVEPVVVKYVKTVVGWYNLYFEGEDKPSLTLSPDKFFEIFPNVSKKAAFGTNELDPSYVKTLVA